MKKLSFLLALAIAASTTCAVLAGNDDDAATLSQISGYRQWTRVNSEPVKVQVPVTVTDGSVSVNPTALV